MNLRHLNFSPLVDPFRNSIDKANQEFLCSSAGMLLCRKQLRQNKHFVSFSIRYPVYW